MGEARYCIEVRDRNHCFDEIPKYYDSGNAILTMEWEALALIIPPGERFFVRSVQRFAQKARDPKLNAKIKGFIGQEAMHAKETDRSLEPLERNGFPVSRFQNRFDKFLCWLGNMPFPKWILAGTAAAEHYTAALGRWNISNGHCDSMPTVLRDLWYWHGAEELEHKAVSFDLLNEVAPRNYILRFAGFIVGMGVIWLGYRMAMRMLFKHSGLTKAQLREERRKARKIRIPLLCLRFPGLLTYLRPGFHPDEMDDRHLCKEILSQQATIPS